MCYPLKISRELNQVPGIIGAVLVFAGFVDTVLVFAGFVRSATQHYF